MIKDYMTKDYVVKKARKNWRRLLRIFQKKEKSDVVFFTNDMVQEYVNFHRALQATIAIVSNYRAGIDVKSPDFNVRGIYKAEGGVKVGDKDIVIKRYDGTIRCYNDWNEKEKGTPNIVKDVVEELLRIRPKEDVAGVLLEYAVENTDVPKDILREKIVRFVSQPFGGDTLWRLFQEV